MDNNFETCLAELEKIVNKLENSDIPLDEAIKLFEEGVKMSDICRKTLKEAEQKIITLTSAEREEIDD